MSKSEAIRNVVARARAAGDFRMPRALVHLMTAEERTAYETTAAAIAPARATFRGSYRAALAHFGCPVRKIAGGILAGSVAEWAAV